MSRHPSDLARRMRGSTTAYSRSTTRLATTTATTRMAAIAWITSRSFCWMANSSRSPIPFGPKNCSAIDGAADQRRHLQGDAGHQRQDRHPQGVAPQHAPRRDALGPGHVDGVALQGEDHVGAQQPAPHGAEPSPSTSAGMKKFWKCSTGSSHGATYLDRPTLGKNSKRLTTRNSTSTAMTSGGVEMNGERADARRPVEQRVAPVGAVHAERHGDQQPDEDRPEHDEHRGRHALLEHLDRRLAGDVRAAPVAGEDVLQPVPVLHEQRFVEVRVVLVDPLRSAPR